MILHFCVPCFVEVYYAKVSSNIIFKKIICKYFIHKYLSIFKCYEFSQKVCGFGLKLKVVACDTPSRGVWRELTLSSKEFFWHFAY